MEGNLCFFELGTHFEASAQQEHQRQRWGEEGARVGRCQILLCWKKAEKQQATAFEFIVITDYKAAFWFSEDNLHGFADGYKTHFVLLLSAFVRFKTAEHSLVLE